MKVKACSILIVEDELIASEYLKDILHSFHAKQIFEATNAKEAQHIVQNHHIDLIFMDINIEGAIDGIACASLLNKEYFIPIIFTTSYGDTATINEAKEENTFGYLIKPFQPNDVEASLLIALSTLTRINQLNEIEKQPQKSVQIIDLNKNYLYYISSKTLTFCNIPINLTKKELEILDILCQNLNQNISYDYIKETIWSQKDISDSTLRDTISRLKKKIPHITIENIVNYGYILKQSTKG
ncbi:MAG: response regulator [Arcobacteraceae bacterium]